MTDLDLSLKLRNFEVGADGICRNMGTPSIDLDKFSLRSPYYFSRFLHHLDTLIELTSDDLERIRVATFLTRYFLSQAQWVTDACPPGDLEKRAATKPLYRDPNSPFEVHVFSWLPQKSDVHSHGSWSIVAFLGDATAGRELNYFWRRFDDGTQSGHAVVKPMSKQILEPGDIIGFTADAIHNIKSISAENEPNLDNPKPTLMFNIFGDRNPSKRYLFNPFENTLKNY
jgi:predicted metal-dependent enzyme (double-stranded beta helix superfamily)